MELQFNFFLMDTTLSSAVDTPWACFSVLEKIIYYSQVSAPIIIQRSPLFGLTVFPCGNSSPLEHQNHIKKIRILMPLQAMPEADLLKFRYQANCMYCDAAQGPFRTSGLLSAHQSFAICASKHQTVLVVAQINTIPEIQIKVAQAKQNVWYHKLQANTQ